MNNNKKEEEALRREQYHRSKELAKTFYGHFLISYLNRNNPDPSWKEIDSPLKDGTKWIRHTLANPTLEHFNEAVQDVAAGAFQVPLCSEHPLIPLSKGEENDIVIEGNKIKQEDGHSFIYLKIVEKLANNPTITVLYECRHCGLWRLEEKSSDWKGE
jgi:hypothetical protein